MCSEISFVCVFVIRVCTCVCSPVCGHLEARETSGVLFCSMPEVFETGFLAELGAHHSWGVPGILYLPGAGSTTAHHHG